jgi:hypothetical protein
MTVGGFLSLVYVVIAYRPRAEEPAGASDFSLLHNVGTDPVSVQWVPGAVS